MKRERGVFIINGEIYSFEFCLGCLLKFPVAILVFACLLVFGIGNGIVSANAGIPLTRPDLTSVVSVVSGSEHEWKDAENLIRAMLMGGSGTLVFLMGHGELQSHMERLAECGLSVETPIALIRRGTKPGQEVLTATVGTVTEEVAGRKFESPAIMIVGDVARFRATSSWFESKPLFGKRVVVTRPLPQATRFADLLADSGAAVFRFPMIETIPVSSYAALDSALQALHLYDWVIFSSVNGVKYFFERLRRNGQDIRTLRSASVAAIGPETAKAVEDHHLRVELIPPLYKAEDLVGALLTRRPSRVLLPRATGARDILPMRLRQNGVRVDEVSTYQSVRPRGREELLRDMLRDGAVDLLTFTSTSTVANFITCFEEEGIEDLIGSVRVGCIGPITAAAARGYGLTVSIEPEEYTIPAFADAIIEYFQERPDMNNSSALEQ